MLIVKRFSLYKGVFLFIYNRFIFLTRTAFADINEKYDIPLSRYTVFFKTVLKGTTPLTRIFLIISQALRN